MVLNHGCELAPTAIRVLQHCRSEEIIEKSSALLQMPV